MMPGGRIVEQVSRVVMVPATFFSVERSTLAPPKRSGGGWPVPKNAVKIRVSFAGKEAARLGYATYSGT